MRGRWLVVIAIEVVLLIVVIGALTNVGAFLPYGMPAMALRQAPGPVAPIPVAAGSLNSPPPPDAPDPLHCPYQVGPRLRLFGNAGPTTCANQVRDAAQRRALDPADQAAMSDDVDALATLVRRADGRTGTCVSISVGHVASEGVDPLDSCLRNPADPADLAGRMVVAGYAHPVIRRAGPADVGPPGSIVFAVPVGAGCVLGYDGAWRSAVAVGYRFDGSCLSG